VKKVLVLPGDGIGQEVVNPAVEVMQVAAQQQGVTIDVEEALVGGAAIDDCGSPLPESTLAKAKAADAVLLGGVGGPKWDDLPDGPAP
jgi:3-isopropylmalate dehydrogenase